MTLILAGDVGRLNTLRLVDTEARPPLQRSFEKNYRSADYENSGLLAMVRQFLQDAAMPPNLSASLHNPAVAKKACFALPCPIINNTANLTYKLRWPQIAAEQLAQAFRFNQIGLINDFEAVGFGVITLEESDLHTLQQGNPGKGSPQERNQIAIIGAGSGLGEAFVIKDAIKKPDGVATPIVCASEGGHADYAPYSQYEIDLWTFLQKDTDSLHVDMEMVISGKGILQIYRFLRDVRQLSESPDMAKIVKTWEEEAKLGVKSLDPAAEIAKAALFKRDPLCEKSMQIFLKAYGAEAGNFALKLKPYGGLYVAGSIAPRILPLFKGVDFLDAFNQKGKVGKNLLPDIPVRVVLNPQVGLKGAEYYAVNVLN
ncbi:MAG: glucokinase [Oscillatoria princeps RMCB-10]|jgi:glucokinase|nr:glucokinase [Oscillatoria princeps RMCB-10]